MPPRLSIKLDFYGKYSNLTFISENMCGSNGQHHYIYPPSNNSTEEIWTSHSVNIKIHSIGVVSQN